MKKINAYLIYEMREHNEIPLLGVMCTREEVIEIAEEIKRNNPLMRIAFKRVCGVAMCERG